MVMKKKFLYSASVVLLGAGLGIAQCATSSTAGQPKGTAASDDSLTPSALHPQTNSPDSVSRWNPVTGQNPDSQRNPNAESLSSRRGSTEAAGNDQAITPVGTQPSGAATATDTSSNSVTITAPSDDSVPEPSE